jgi:hypothetical protein
MPSDDPKAPAPPAKSLYSTPQLERYGSIVEHTLARSTVGKMDGGPMNARTG